MAEFGEAPTTMEVTLSVSHTGQIDVPVCSRFIFYFGYISIHFVFYKKSEIHQQWHLQSGEIYRNLRYEDSMKIHFVEKSL